MMISTPAHNKRTLPAIVPLSFLVLTCCMGQVQAETPVVRDPGSAVAASGHGVAVPITIAASSSTAPDAAALLNQKSAKFSGSVTKATKKAKKPARKGMAEEIEAEAEEETEEVDEEETEVDPPTGGGGFRSKSIQADFDQNVRATLKEVIRRGSVLSVTVALSYQSAGKNKSGKDKVQSEYLSTSTDATYTHLMDYDSGTAYGPKKHDGFTGGRLQSGQGDKTLRVTFEAPPTDTKTVGITIYGIGTFDDVSLRGSAPSLSAKPSGNPGKHAPEATEEEDEDEEEDEEEDDVTSLRQTKKKK